MVIIQVHLRKLQYRHVFSRRKGTDEYVWDHYEESVPMSTYLVAFVVSQFKYETAPPTGNNVTFRIWAQDSALDQITYAKSIGGEILKYFETYFNIKYPLPKQVIMIDYISEHKELYLDLIKF